MKAPARLLLPAILLATSLAGCAQTASAIHDVHVEVRFGSTDGPLVQPFTTALTFHPLPDPAQEDYDAYDAARTPTFHVEGDFPSVRVHVQGRQGCTSEQSDEVFLPVGHQLVNVTVVLYATSLSANGTLRFASSAAAARQGLALPWPTAGQAGYRARLVDGNVSIAWSNDAATHGSFAAGFGADGATLRQGASASAVSGPAKASATLGPDAARRAAVADSIQAFAASDGPVTAPQGLDVQMHATLRFVGQGSEIAQVHDASPSHECELP